MRELHHWVPLPFIEVSHFLGSIVGVALLIVARGLYRKLDSAWWLATSLIATGMLCSLMKGFDYEEAILLGFVLVCCSLIVSSFIAKDICCTNDFRLVGYPQSRWLSCVRYGWVRSRSSTWSISTNFGGSFPLEAMHQDFFAQASVLSRFFSAFRFGNYRNKRLEYSMMRWKARC